MKYITLFFLLGLHLVIQAQVEPDFISEEKMKEFTNFCQGKTPVEYLEVLENAKEVFVVSKKINKTLLEKYFTAPRFYLTNEDSKKTLKQYLLFNGTNRVVGQAIVLSVHKDDKVEKLEIIGWGR